MPLQPSRRDILGPPPRDVSDLANIVRHDGSYLRQLDPGMLDGRWNTPRPVRGDATELVGDDGEGSGDTSSVLGEDEDRHVCLGPGQQLFPLSYIPIEETVHLYWHASATSAGVPWLRGEHWDIDDLGRITIYGFARGGMSWPKKDHVFSAKYLRLEGEDQVQEAVFLGSWVLDAAAPAEIDTGIIQEDGASYLIHMWGNYAIDGPFIHIPEFPEASPVWDGNPSFTEPQADSVVVFRRAPSESDTWTGRWGASNPVQYSRSSIEGWHAWAADPSPEFYYSGGYPAGDPAGNSSDVIEGVGGEELRFKFIDSPSTDNNGSVGVEVYEI